MRDGTAERRAQLYQEAIQLIADEYAEDLHLERVARRLATSRRQLQRAFAEAGETSFRDELANVRMHHARALLAADELPVRQVAARVGYHQPAQFAKSFRRYHGQPPSTYRRENRRVAGNGAPPALDADRVAVAASANGLPRAVVSL